MNKKSVILLTIISAIILITLIIIFNSKNDPVKIIKTSVPQGDEIKDPRTSDEACNDELQKIEDTNPNSKCKLTYSKRVDAPNHFEECIEGGSVAGCYVCTFECG